MSALPTVTSPCRNVCEMNAQTGYCRGCWRTLAEIAGWDAFSTDEKTVILSELPLRRQTGSAEPEFLPTDPPING